MLRAVDDVSVDVQPGRVLRRRRAQRQRQEHAAQVHRRDLRHRPGELFVRGRLSPFIELGVGFNMDLTARDNVLINAIMLGLSRKQARERFDEIIAFAELEDFVDLKLKNYSSGMHVSARLLGRDSGGSRDPPDRRGARRGRRRVSGRSASTQFQRLKREGRTILFVTHDMGSVERFCDRAMLLEKGRMVAIGEPAAIARRYIQLNFGQTVHELLMALTAGRHSRTSRPQRSRRRMVRGLAGGERIAELEYGEPCRVCIEIRFHGGPDRSDRRRDAAQSIRGYRVRDLDCVATMGPRVSFDAGTTRGGRTSLRQLAGGESV